MSFSFFRTLLTLDIVYKVKGILRKELLLALGKENYKLLKAITSQVQADPREWVWSDTGHGQQLASDSPWSSLTAGYVSDTVTGAKVQRHECHHRIQQCTLRPSVCQATCRPMECSLCGERRTQTLDSAQAPALEGRSFSEGTLLLT